MLLNSTLVETGQRLIFSDLAVGAPAVPAKKEASDQHFLAARDAAQFLFHPGAGTPVLVDVPLSTAAHASARFTYTNPQGTLGTGQHFVDGGYFENSGAVTALELVQALRSEKGARPERIVPVVILISNGPRDPDGDKILAEKLAAKGVGVSPPLAPESVSETRSFAIDLLAPPEAIMNTRDARGQLALAALRHDLAAQAAADGDALASLPRVIEFSLLDRGIPLPLGWSLSKAAVADMAGQIGDEKDKSRGLTSNHKAMEDVLRWLALAAQR